MKKSLAIAGALLVWACASKPARTNQGEQLYFSLEVRHQGHLVAKPRLLGESGKIARVERRQPGAALADYRLVLVPRVSAAGYHLRLELSLPDAHGATELDLVHGQVRQLELGPKAGELQVSLLLMKVDSPEFRMLMDLGERESDSPRSI